MFKENAIRILSAAGVEFRQLHFPHNERLLVLRSLSAVSGAPPCDGWLAGRTVCGRFRYSDLKEAALSGAADLWELYGTEVLAEGRCCRFHRERPPARARDTRARRRRCVLGCHEKQAVSSPKAVCGVRGTDRVCMPEHGDIAGLELCCHAARRSGWGGERRSS
jgi:hypothetical protein